MLRVIYLHKAHPVSNICSSRVANQCRRAYGNPNFLQQIPPPNLVPRLRGCRNIQYACPARILCWPLPIHTQNFERISTSNLNWDLHYYRPDQETTFLSIMKFFPITIFLDTAYVRPTGCSFNLSRTASTWVAWSLSQMIIQSIFGNKREYQGTKENFKPL